MCRCRCTHWVQFTLVRRGYDNHKCHNKKPDRKWDWGSEWRHARKRWAGNFGDFWKKAVRFDSEWGQSSWGLRDAQRVYWGQLVEILTLGRAVQKWVEILTLGRTVQLGVSCGRCRNNQHSKNCVSLSSCRKTKSQDVAYWPLTRSSCQKKKCTCVNNRCIRSKISGDQGRSWLLRGWILCELWRSQEVGGSQIFYNPGDRKFRSVGEKMQEREPCPSSPGKRERNTVIAGRVWGQYVAIFVRSPTHSHTQPFQ